MYTLIGQNSLRGLNNNTAQREPSIYAPRGGLMPVLGSGGTYLSTFEKNFRQPGNTWGNGYWGGLTTQFSLWDPFSIAAEFSYGQVDMSFTELLKQNECWRSVATTKPRLFRKGYRFYEDLPEMYFLVSGKVRLMAQVPDGNEKTLWYLGDGSCFNETPMFYMANGGMEAL